MSFTSATDRWADVYLVAGSRGISVCGDFMAATTLALTLQQAGHGGLAVAGLELAVMLPLVLAAPLAGRLVDRVDSRTLLVVTGLVQAVICTFLAFAGHPVLIIALVALLACGLAITQPTQSALLPDMVGEAGLARASGLTQTAGVIGMLAAPAVAGVLVGQTGSRVPLLIDAATYVLLAAAALAIKTRRRGANHEATADVRWRLRDDRTLLLMVGVLAACVLGLGAVNVFEIFFIRETLAASTTMFGLVAASWTAGMLIGTVVFGRVPRHRMTVPVQLLVMAGSCVPLIAGATVGSAAWLIPLWIIGGLANGGTNVMVMVIVADRTPGEARGRAFATVGSAIQGAGVVGLLVAGPLVDHLSPRLLVAAGGAAGLLAVLVCLPLAMRHEPPSRPATGRRQPAGDSVGA